MPGSAPGRLLPLLLLLCWLLPLSAAAEQGALHPFSAEYRLTRDGVPIGSTRVTLEYLPDGGYLYRARTEPNAVVSLVREESILEESQGRVVEGRPRPDHYLYRRDGDGPRHRLRLEFDWPRLRVQIDDESSSWHMEVTAQTLDKLVQQLVFTRELGQGVRRADYRVADGGRLKEYRYRVLGRESVVTPLGRFDAFKVARSKGSGASDYTLWLAPTLNHRPVRILRRHRGSLYRMELVEFENGEN